MQSRTLRNSNYRAEALVQFMFSAVLKGSKGKSAGRVTPQTGSSQQKPAEPLSLSDLHVVPLLQMIPLLLVCFSFAK